MYYEGLEDAELAKLVGKTLKSIKGMEYGSYYVTFETDCGEEYNMFHSQDCCEEVYLVDVVGDVADIIGNPILIAEMSCSENNTAELEQLIKEKDIYQECFVWTFYKFATIKGYVTLRWHGSSNGYYSVRVRFSQATSN